MSREPPKPRPRFSLLNLVLLMTIAAMAVALWRQYSELAPLRAENKTLNEERGTLVIADRSRVSAIRVPARFAGNPNTFRIFIPEGQEYVAVVAVNNIPKTGLPKVERRTDRSMVLGQAGKNAFARLPPGEHQLSLVVKRRPNGESYVWFASNANGPPLDMSVTVSEGSWPKETPETYSVFNDGVRGTTESVAAGQPLVLLRNRLQATSEHSLRVSYVLPEPDYPLDGMMLWLEPLTEE